MRSRCGVDGHNKLGANKMANADVVVIQAIAPANLAWKRGDISVVLSVIKSVFILFLPAQGLLSNYGTKS
jgi:hypothetical protein